MSKEQWFRNFERELAERGWPDSGDDADYEEAGEAAYDALREQALDRADLERKRQKEEG